MPGKAAARVGDPTGHPGIITGGVDSVLIGNLAAAVMDASLSHTCAMPSPGGPHPKSPIATGSATVLIGGNPAARVGDSAGCGSPIVMGALTVLIGG